MALGGEDDSKIGLVMVEMFAGWWEKGWGEGGMKVYGWVLREDRGMVSWPWLSEVVTTSC